MQDRREMQTGLRSGNPKQKRLLDRSDNGIKISLKYDGGTKLIRFRAASCCECGNERQFLVYLSDY